MQLKQEISKNKESLQEREQPMVGCVKQHLRHKVRAKPQEKGESIMQLIQSHKDDMNKMNERGKRSDSSMKSK